MTEECHEVVEECHEVVEECHKAVEGYRKAEEEYRKVVEKYQKVVEEYQKAVVEEYLEAVEEYQKAVDEYQKKVVEECRREVRRLMAEKNCSNPLILRMAWNLATTHNVHGFPFAAIAGLCHLHLTIKLQFPIFNNDDIWLLVGVVALENICRPELDFNPGHEMDDKIYVAILGEAALALPVEDRFNRLLEAQIVQGIKSFRIDNKLMAIFEIHGCLKTPYFGGVYEFLAEIHDEYPQRCPVLKFTTPIWHPSVESATGKVLGAIPSNDGIYLLNTVPSFVMGLMKQKLDDKFHEKARRLTEVFAMPQANTFGNLRLKFEQAKTSDYAATWLTADLQNLERMDIYQRKDWTLINSMFDWLDEREIHHIKPILHLSHLLNEDLNEVHRIAEEAGFQVEADQPY